MSWFHSDMKKNLILLGALFVLYFATGYTLKSVYGDSFPFMQGEDYWLPDGNGGWEKHGDPSAAIPSSTSQDVPLIMVYIPFLVPSLVLILFLFTPLGKLLETKKKEDETDEVISDSSE